MPTRKVTAGTVAGALTTIIVWVVSEFFQVEIPPPVAAAITVILAMGTAYLVPNRDTPGGY
jgi:putative flippase GtrA